MAGRRKMHLGYPVLEMYDDTYTRGISDTKLKEAFGHLVVRRSNTIGRDYLLLMNVATCKHVDRDRADAMRALGRPAEHDSVGIRMHAGQVRRLRDYLTKWLDSHAPRKADKHGD